MKFSSAHVGLGAVLPVVVMATHPKEWEQQRQLFEKRTISNSNFTGNNGNLNGNTAVIDSNIASGNVDSGNEINSNNHGKSLSWVTSSSDRRIWHGWRPAMALALLLTDCVEVLIQC